MRLKSAITDAGRHSYTLFELLAGVGLVASIIVFVSKTAGFGTYLARIDAISCSPDGDLIAVSKRSTINKRYAENCQVLRTVSCLDSRTGSHQYSIRKDQQVCWVFQEGRSFDRYPETPVLWHQATNQLLVTLDDGRVEFYSIDSVPRLLHMISLHRNQGSIAMSKSGRYLARFDPSIIIWDVAQSRPKVLPGCSVGTKLVFSDDESQVLIANESGLHSWEIPSFDKSATLVPFVTGGRLAAIGACANDSVIACAQDEASRLDVKGNRQTVWPQIHGARVCCVSCNGHLAAMANSKAIFVVDLRTNAMIATIPFDRVSALGFLANANALIVGDDDGYVHSIALPSGKVLWRSDPPLSHPTSRVWPLLLMLGCGLVCAKRVATMSKGMRFR